MAEVNRLHRSDNAVVAGVCAGLAERFDIDPIAARILAVLLTVCTAGLALVAYVAAWLVLPGKIEAPAPIACAAYVPASASAGQMSVSERRRLRGSAPMPPAGFVVEGGECKPEPIAPRTASGEPCEQCGMSGLARLCVWIGSIILAVDVALLFDYLVEGIVWWRLWPVVILIAGFVLMFIPAKSGRYARRFSCGLALVAIGAVVLLMSIGVLSPLSAAYAVSKLWPVFLVIAGLVVMSASLHDEMFDFGVALCVIVVCVATCTAFAIPGPLEHIAVNMPFGLRVYDVNPWL